MVDALLFGSIGVLAETSEIQRQAYNRSFQEHGLGWYWNIANYCELLKMPGGKRRLKDFSNVSLPDDVIDSIHDRKESIFFERLKSDLSPRDGVTDCIRVCKQKDIKIGFITTTSQRNIESLTQALDQHVDFEQFDLITTKSDVGKEKPSGEVYKFALSKIEVSAEKTIAIEDTEINQQAALENGIQCYLFAGEYATTQHNFNAIKTLKAISSQL
jgi:HAD superfamily hydrolase (TIGR01509 family)